MQSFSRSVVQLLARFRRARSFGRPPYEESEKKSLMKTSFQRAFLSIPLTALTSLASQTFRRAASCPLSRARSFGRSPYEESEKKSLMKTSFQRAFLSIPLTALTSLASQTFRRAASCPFSRARSFGRPPYEDLESKSLMKTSFQRAFLSKSSHDGTVT